MSEKNENLNFEDSIKKLDEIAGELESGKLNLEESIKMFEEGIELSGKCSKFLEDAEKRITILVDNNGKIEEKEFIVSEEI